MRKVLKIGILVILLLGLCVALLNIEVTTGGGINYKVYTAKIPLYLKVLNFFNRHYNYKWLTERVVGDIKGEEEKALKILDWTFNHMKKQPEGLPVMDDHTWNIIIQGYGVHDSFGIVYATLCNYAGLDAFKTYLHDKKGSRRSITLVKINDEWSVIDPYNGIYFRNKNRDLASIKDIKNGNWRLVQIADTINSRMDYEIFFKSLPAKMEFDLNTANIQSPWNRLRFQIKNLIGFP